MPLTLDELRTILEKSKAKGLLFVEIEGRLAIIEDYRTGRNDIVLLTEPLDLHAILNNQTEDLEQRERLSVQSFS